MKNNQYDDEIVGNSFLSNKKIIYPIIGILIVICIVGGFFIKKKMDISSLEKKAESFIGAEEYSEAKKIYEELYTKTGSVDYKTKGKQLDILDESKKNLEQAKSYQDEGELVKALIMYKKVPMEDQRNYETASEQIDFVKKDIIKKANMMIESGNKSMASSLLSDYLSIVSDDKSALDLMKKVSGKSEQEIKQVVVTRDITVQSQPVHNPSGIVGTYQTITSGEANVRSGPSKSSPVIGSISRGSSVYIYDIYVESAYRTWCKTDAGWISYNTMNGSIR